MNCSYKLTFYISNRQIDTFNLLQITMPKTKKPIESTRVKRQASKVALKQLQLLLDDEDDDAFVVQEDDSSSKDTRLELPPPPPLKKRAVSLFMIF